MIYLAPQFVSQKFYEYDYNANPPGSGTAKTLYITYLNQDTPYKYFFQGYNITSPPTSGWLSGALKGPRYDNFQDWDWKTMSGGWHNRDWSQHTDAGRLFTVDKFAQDIEFQDGASQTTTYEMTDSVTKGYEVDKEINANAKILGFVDVSGRLAFTQESDVTNLIQKGLEFVWEMYMPENGECGYKTVVIEPQILTPTGAENGSLPWVPSAYTSHLPWLITYNLVEAEKTDNCKSTGFEPNIQTSIDPVGSGTITLTPSSPVKGENVLFKAEPKSGYVFSHWQAWGINISDYSSSAIHGTIHSDISTIRAYFEKAESDEMLSADIKVTSGSHGGSVALTGKIPSAITRIFAMDLTNPLIVTVGGREFRFGPSVGDRDIVSSSKIIYSTTDKHGTYSQLILDFNTNTWAFSSPWVKSHVIDWKGSGHRTLS